ncbi:hypothetical protein FEM48_Zijuj08G0203300 [Ziziphus jujuba var. spinosa]|uniref:Peptidyl-tRNA hydrolase, mitochondrial n=1 Tax=Ziziphus jujuba var. spinosa TaxID=714518 RepID=A0A978V166_ZIZJJ|nr:hypothetical protein FEM48_Zijuj08G0203300 [Ziziphus jujuba var. spinosa]
MLNRLSRRCFCTAAQPAPWLFVGLGNPGDKFKGTRHNVGFEMIDAFAESQGIAMNTLHCKAIFGQGFVGGIPVFLAKPQTYMNLCGESTGPLGAYYKLPLNRVLVFIEGFLLLFLIYLFIYFWLQFHDDMNLPCGVLRLHDKGGHGSHNGNFSVVLLDKIDDALKEGVAALKLLLSKGLTETARIFNTDQKYKHIRYQTLPTP